MTELKNKNETILQVNSVVLSVKATENWIYIGHEYIITFSFSEQENLFTNISVKNNNVIHTNFAFCL